MKKIYAPGVAVVAILTFVLCFSVKVSADSDSRNPFHAIWEMVKNLQDQINNIQLIPGPQGLKGDQGLQGEPGPSTFPPPDFNSGWITLPSRMAVIDVPHNVGGDVNNYFIEATYMRQNDTLTSHQTAADKVWWEDVEPNNIQVITNGDVTNEFKAARIRIWKIQ